MRKIKFRGKSVDNGEWVYGNYMEKMKPTEAEPTFWCCFIQDGALTMTKVDPETVGQFLMLKDEDDKEWYIGDIGEFDNGDKFVLKMEWFLTPFAEWIGEADCEDQTRDLYRIEKAKKIGNTHDNPELLK